MEAGRRGAARLMLRVWQLQRGWLPQQGEHQARRPMATLPGVPGANPPPPPRSTPAAPPPKGAPPPPPQQPAASSTAGAEAPGPSPSTASAAPPPPPPPPGGAAVPPKNVPRPSKLVPGLSDPFFLIPLFGVPGLALYYGYQVYLQQQHEARIAGVHSAIKQEREKVARPTGKQLAQVLSAAPTAPPPKPAPAAPTPSPAPAPPPASTSGAAPPAGVAAAAAPATSTKDVTPAAAPPPAAAVKQEQALAPAPATEPQAAAQAVLQAAAAAGAGTAAASAAPVASPAPPAAAEKEVAPAPPAPVAEAAAAAGGSPGVAAAHHVPVLSSSKEPEVPPVPKGVMGVSLDLTPAGLVQFAIERGAGPGEDWAAFESRHKQAVADAELMGRAVAQIRAWHEDHVGALKAELEASHKKVQETVELAQAQAEAFKRLLKQHQEMAAELRQLEVSQAEKRATLAAHKVLDAERLARSQVLDELRLEVSALAAAHDSRAGQQAVSSQSHALELSILALGQALDAGQPLQPHVAKVLQATAADAGTGTAGQAVPLVREALKSLPATAVASGVPTVPHLVERLRSMKGAVNTLSLLPAPSAVAGEGGSPARTGGIVTHAVARLFAWLKADETAVVRSLGPDVVGEAGSASASTALALAEVLAGQGRLEEAAQALRRGAQGSAAAVAVDAWCADAHSRAVADQALRLLRAHAAVLAAASI